MKINWISEKMLSKSIQKCTVIPVNMSVQGNILHMVPLVPIQAKPSIDT